MWFLPCFLFSLSLCGWLFGVGVLLVVVTVTVFLVIRCILFYTRVKEQGK
jgi:hypothetical protein